MECLMKLYRIALIILAGVLTASCADLDYTEQSTRDEEWTY